ncbi:unnamed protein product [Fusarium venenatum]|uniref:Uncharacterized protein n=1 Tax=Fusarium venenatum TaxID=56646 RepID=A0A2L2U342_9HYPO|nr:uncharacterized protein FVRRES_09112 [Fusarium venenatum]CEI69035.1 unnamed protein product [Fusarium venenatum]
MIQGRYAGTQLRTKVPKKGGTLFVAFTQGSWLSAWTVAMRMVWWSEESSISDSSAASMSSFGHS